MLGGDVSCILLTKKSDNCAQLRGCVSLSFQGKGPDRSVALTWADILGSQLLSLGRLGCCTYVSVCLRELGANALGLGFPALHRRVVSSG